MGNNCVLFNEGLDDEQISGEDDDCSSDEDEDDDQEEEGEFDPSIIANQNLGYVVEDEDY